MPKIIKLAVFNEQYSVGYDAHGNPVQRALRYMTADETIAAVLWATGEKNRLDREAEPARRLLAALEKGRRNSLSGMPPKGVKSAPAKMRAAAAATDRHARLLSLIQAAMPQWQRQL